MVVEGRSSREKPDKAGCAYGLQSPESKGQTRSAAGQSWGPGWSCDLCGVPGYFSRGLVHTCKDHSDRAKILNLTQTDAAGDGKL